MSILPTIVREHWQSAAIQRIRRTGQGTHRLEQHVPLLMGNERILARAKSPDGAVVLGSERALYIASGPDGWRRIDWVSVASLTRSSASNVILRLWPTGEVRVQTNSTFATFAVERVAATQLLRRQIPISAGFAIVTAVRAPGQDTVLWRVELDRHCDGNDAEIRLAVQRAVIELRALAGC